MDRRYYCKCANCGTNTEYKDLKDKYIICAGCHRILDITGDLYVNGIKLSVERENELISSLNPHNKSQTILLEGDDILNDSI